MINLVGLIFWNTGGYAFPIRKMSYKVFVYGTLKRNEPNHHWLTKPENGASKFISEGTTKTKYPLIIATRYNIPFLLQSPGDGNHVKGEIYEVDDKMLANLDILEDHPNYYVREIDEIMVQGKEETDKCWVYFLKKFKPELLKRPTMENYSSTGGHGLKYMERCQRDPNYDYKPEASHKVFVYGTLKRNEPNHHWLTKPENGISKFISEGTTKTKYPLVVAPRYTYPFLLQSPGRGNHVKGEIYEVDDKMLSNLDILEGHPNYYVREIDDIILQGKKETNKCWVYFLKKFESDLMKRPMMENFSSAGGHGLKYTESYNHNESTLKDLDDDVLKK